MGIREIEKEYEEIKHNLKKMAEEELKEINEKINVLEDEVEEVGRKTEEELNKKIINKREKND